MHIPESMLTGVVCPITFVIAGTGVAFTEYKAYKEKEKPSSLQFAAVTALIFALQMLNYPVQNGTSGHLLGAVLAVSLLKNPFAVLSMTIVLFVQALFFGDGGINALGANIINMALIATGLGGWLIKKFSTKFNQKISLALAAILSVILSAAACSTEVALSGTVAFNKVLPAMLSIHAIIGLGEAILTLGIFSLLNYYQQILKENKFALALGSGILAALSLVLSPFASSFPDGLEWIGERLSFVQFASFKIAAIFNNYQITLIKNFALSTMISGTMGALIVFSFSFFIGRLLIKQTVKK